ncbi:hypothetical protein [Methylacidimicrobium tartarophylax]|uniref:hypothetical protein n=1 Tax=Methylacidimicrobium tartarophylax TaxID=1041768 RepID=UPI00115A856E|nr:hypothetical protein [Methylacidimicrobium tartarophylax]
MAFRFQKSPSGAPGRWRLGRRCSALVFGLCVLAIPRLLPAAYPEEGKQKAAPLLLAAPQILSGPAGEGKAVAERITAGQLSEAEEAADRELRIATSLQAGGEIDPTKRLQSASSMLGFAFRVAIPYNNLGVVYTLQKRYAEAHKTISRAIGIQRAALSQAQTDTTFHSTLAYIQAGRGAGKIVEQQRVEPIRKIEPKRFYRFFRERIYATPSERRTAKSSLEQSLAPWHASCFRRVR